LRHNHRLSEQTWQLPLHKNKTVSIKETENDNKKHTIAKASNTADGMMGDEASQLRLVVRRVGDVTRALAIVRETH
jgi:hypothetical protein